MKTTFSKISYTGLADLLDKHHEQVEQIRELNEQAAFTKMQLTQYAVDQNLLDCITVNTKKLERYAQ